MLEASWEKCGNSKDVEKLQPAEDYAEGSVAKQRSSRIYYSDAGNAYDYTA